MESINNNERLMPEIPQDMDAVMATYEAPLLRYATRLLNDPSTAQDVVQNTFLKLYKHWRNGVKPTDQLQGWLYRVTHNNAVDHIRRENRLRVLHNRRAEQVELEQEEQRESALDRREALSLALRYVRKLDPSEQQVVILRLQEGKSYKEIAAITKRTEGNIGCILHHAVKKLSVQLKKAGVTA